MFVISPEVTADGIEWSAILSINESGGKNDEVNFSEASDGSDGYDYEIYDKVNPLPPPQPYLDAYFTTPFASPADIW